MSTYRELRDLIVTGQLSARERVSESDLAQRLAVSRTPVREALQRLEGDGLVQGQGRGVRVVVLSAAELQHVYRVRAALEALTAEVAAERQAAGLIAPAELVSLDELAAAADATTRAGDLVAAAAQNRAFHLAIAVLAANPVALDALERLWDQIQVSTRDSLRVPERIEAVDTEHRSLVAYLKSGDSIRAGPAAMEHVRATLSAQD
jgi:DNA-binding GntR family transcriptional regulator